MLESYLAAVSEPITNPDICPAMQCEKVDSQGNCKCDSKDEECKVQVYIQ